VAVKNFKFVSPKEALPKGQERSMKVKITGLLFISLWFALLSPAYAEPEPGYFTQLGRTFTRGVKNIVSFPWEIPLTVKEYDGKTNGNSRAIRDMAGVVDGTFRSLTRLGCGLWDVVFAFVPGDQDDLPLKPQTLF